MKDIGKLNNPTLFKSHNNGSSQGNVSPTLQHPRVSHQPGSSNGGYEYGKSGADDMRNSGNKNGYIIDSNSGFSSVSPKADGEYKKKIPTFLEQKSGLKGSLFMGEATSGESDSPGIHKYQRADHANYQQHKTTTDPYHKRIPRKSEQP